MSAIQMIGVVLTLSWLLVSYNAGSHLASLICGYRVVRVSVGYGPALFRFTIGNTVFQLALIPFGGYVQIDGMNPLEGVDPRDRGSFANGSLWGRAITVLGGPLGNLIPAFVLFALASVAGYQVAQGPLGVVAARGIAESTLEPGDRLLEIDGAPVTNTVGAVNRLGVVRGNEITLTVEHRGRRRQVKLRPQQTGDDQGRYGITLGRTWVEHSVSARDAPGVALRQMRLTVASIGATLATIVSNTKGFGNPQATPYSTSEKRRGRAVLVFAGLLATYLGFFNLLPFPALNGGRLAFLVYEAISRRKPNARLEYWAHALGMVLLLGTIAFVSMFDVFSAKTAVDKAVPPPTAAASQTKSSATTSTVSGARDASTNAGASTSLGCPSEPCTTPPAPQVWRAPFTLSSRTPTATE